MPKHKLTWTYHGTRHAPIGCTAWTARWGSMSLRITAAPTGTETYKGWAQGDQFRDRYRKMRDPAGGKPDTIYAVYVDHEMQNIYASETTAKRAAVRMAPKKYREAYQRGSVVGPYGVVWDHDGTGDGDDAYTFQIEMPALDDVGGVRCVIEQPARTGKFEPFRLTISGVLVAEQESTKFPESREYTRDLLMERAFVQMRTCRDAQIDTQFHPFPWKTLHNRAGVVASVKSRGFLAEVFGWHNDSWEVRVKTAGGEKVGDDKFYTSLPEAMIRAEETIIRRVAADDGENAVTKPEKPEKPEKIAGAPPIESKMINEYDGAQLRWYVQHDDLHTARADVLDGSILVRRDPETGAYRVEACDMSGKVVWTMIQLPTFNEARMIAEWYHAGRDPERRIDLSRPLCTYLRMDWQWEPTGNGWLSEQRGHPVRADVRYSELDKGGRGRWVSATVEIAPTPDGLSQKYEIQGTLCEVLAEAEYRLMAIRVFRDFLTSGDSDARRYPLQWQPFGTSMYHRVAYVPNDSLKVILTRHKTGVYNVSIYADAKRVGGMSFSDHAVTVSWAEAEIATIIKNKFASVLSRTRKETPVKITEKPPVAAVDKPSKGGTMTLVLSCPEGVTAEVARKIKDAVSDFVAVEFSHGYVIERATLRPEPEEIDL